MKLCECGCGTPTTVHRGMPRRFVYGHNLKFEARKKRRSRRVGPSGYMRVSAPDHPRASEGAVLEHIIVAERALGRHLSGTEEVHHVNGVRSDNRPQNLVVCPDRSYHLLLHQRQRALEACGHADWRKCAFCARYDDPENMIQHRRSGGRQPRAAHRLCYNAYANRRYHARRREAVA